MIATRSDGTKLCPDEVGELPAHEHRAATPRVIVVEEDRKQPDVFALRLGFLVETRADLARGRRVGDLVEFDEFERLDSLWLAVFGDDEIFLLEVDDRLALTGGRNDVHTNEIDTGLERRDRRCRAADRSGRSPARVAPVRQGPARAASCVPLDCWPSGLAAPVPRPLTVVLSAMARTAKATSVSLLRIRPRADLPGHRAPPFPGSMIPSGRNEAPPWIRVIETPIASSRLARSRGNTSCIG